MERLENILPTGRTQPGNGKRHNNSVGKITTLLDNIIIIEKVTAKYKIISGK